MGDRTGASRGRRPADHLLSQRRNLPAALCQGADPHGQRHLRRLAHGRRLARQVIGCVPREKEIHTLAATEKTEFNDPDWTVGVKLGRDRNGGYWLLDMVRE